jgi:hypothetical protein
LCFSFLFLHTFVHFLSCFCSSSFHIFNLTTANCDDREVWGVDLRPLASCNCGFESAWGHGSLPLVNVVCCQVEVSATGRSLVQRSPTNRMCACE